ncbi:MAG TPA: hypothetical protein VEI55_00645 [Candidatus Acidoferrum sp.]|nr:hypothetical protein [Candidatus Acidoferrum sp.]
MRIGFRRQQSILHLRCTGFLVTAGYRDGIWASIAAVVGLAIAALMVFAIHPNSSGGQVGWHAGLLPGSIVGAILASAVESYLPRAQSIVYLLSLIAFSFLWYFFIAFVVVKIIRASARKP